METCNGIVSYSIPEDPDVGLDLSDVSYDGEKSGGFLVNGLGRLVDGEIGGDNFRLDIGYGKGNGWVGWKKTSFPRKYIEITFEFDEIRNFSVVHLFTNNFFSKEVQVFSRAKIFFSLGGKFYNGRPVVYNYMPDKVMEVARNVSVHLHGRVGKYVKIHLYFANKWIMLSEVTFESDVAYEGNFTEEVELNALDDEDGYVKYGNSDFNLNTLETIAERKEGQSYVEVIIGVLTALVLLLLIVFIIILLLSRRQKLQGSPNILRNPFGVTINMKDLLMNFTPSNNSGGVVPTPMSADPQGGGSPLSFEQYRSPLVTAYNGLNYATLQSNNEETEVPANKGGELKAPSLPSSPANSDDGYSPSPSGFLPNYSSQALNNKQNNFQLAKSDSVKDVNSYATSLIQINEYASSSQKPNFGTLNNAHYNKQQSYSPRSQMSPISGYNQRFNSAEGIQRKRYHTAPREKHRVPPPVVSWNIAPSMGHTYKCKEAELVPIPRYCLKVTEKVGTCHAGEMILCETEGLNDIIPNCGKTVAVRTRSKDPKHVVSGTTTTNSLREVRFLAGLSDQNIARILGVCTAEQPPWVIFEHPDMGDLAQYLQYRNSSKSTTQNIINNVQVLSYGCLIYMAMQIAAGAKYLESKNVVHKDLAARNCLVGTNYSIKVADIAICSPLYKKDYSEIGGRPPAPIRWLPWESILLDRYTCSSGVWSLAVTIWEVVSMARERPFQHMSNEEVIQNAEHMYYGEELKVLLPRPTLCDEELYDMLCQCWKRDESERPTIKKVHSFLKGRNTGYDPSLH
ncbi:hypothetical protein RUM43_002686 [Polyplax serrata]|uniref:Protein kinase domain-containing protein n=1 Tax=Polyplax serrata TaxID=468196 RepID=A0AAN8S661_POLSC